MITFSDGLEKPSIPAPAGGSQAQLNEYEIKVLRHNLVKLVKETRELSDYLARQKRFLEDMLYNLDDDNMGVALIREKKGMKTQIKVNAEGIETQATRSYAQPGQYYNATYPYTPQELDKEMMWQNTANIDPNGTRYYYWSTILDDWAFVYTPSVSSFFKQTADGFDLKGDVRIRGNLITDGDIRGGTITGTTVNTHRDVNVGRYLRLGYTEGGSFSGNGILNFGGGASIYGANGGDNLIVSAAGVLELGGSTVRIQGEGRVATQEWVENNYVSK